MLKNYLTVAIRSLLKNKMQGVITILSLSVGMGCGLLIFLYVQSELAYDRHHHNVDRIYRVLRGVNPKGQGVSYTTTTSGNLGSALVAEAPEVEDVVRIGRWTSNMWMEHEEKGLYLRFYLADRNFGDVFTLPFVQGDPKTALQDPYSVVVTETTARRFFGDEDPMGKVLSAGGRFYRGDYTVSGVLKDIPKTSSLQFDILSSNQNNSSAWKRWVPTSSWRPIRTYVLLKEGADPKALEARFGALIEKHMGAEVAANNTYRLQALGRTRLYSGVDFGLRSNGNITNIYLFSALGVGILILACVNFINLTTARATDRAKEVGLRKVVGADRAQLVRQFLNESVLQSVCGLLMAMVLVYIALPYFNAFVDKTLSFSTHPGALLTLLGLAIGVGVLSGSYPAFLLSSFQPVTVLKGTLTSSIKSVWIRKSLVVSQFAISILLMIGAGAVYLQLDYIRNRDLGYDNQQMVILPLFIKSPTFGTSESLTKRYNEIKAALLNHPNVLKATTSLNRIDAGGRLGKVEVEGQNTPYQMRVLNIDEDFISTYDISLLAGRNFSLDHPTDITDTFIINELAAKHFGWSDPIGKQMTNGTRIGPVIGMTGNFHNQSFYRALEPVVFAFRTGSANQISLKIKAQNVPETLAHLEVVWNQFVPERPFEYWFLDETMERRFYRTELRLNWLVQVFSGLAIFIACMGLLGLVAFTVRKRTKEAGIRKVLGATGADIMRLLSSEFVWLILLANVIAWPVAYWAVTAWLENFVYRFTPGVGLFALSGFTTFVIAFLTLSLQTFKAARANPVDALRHE